MTKHNERDENDLEPRHELFSIGRLDRMLATKSCRLCLFLAGIFSHCSVDFQETSITPPSQAYKLGSTFSVLIIGWLGRGSCSPIIVGKLRRHLEQFR